MAEFYSAEAGLSRRFRGLILHRRSQAVAIDENDAAQDTPIIDTLAAMALGEIGLKTGHLLLRQPEQITHQSGSYPPV